MAQVNVNEVQAKLSRLLLRVEAGEEIVINRAGVPVAKLVPIAKNLARERTLVEQHLAESKAEIREGRFFGPFDSADETIESLHRNSKARKKINKRPTRK